MDEEKRSNQNYEIIESCTIGSTELVIGHNPNAPNPYVCWYCKGGSTFTKLFVMSWNEIVEHQADYQERWQKNIKGDDVLLRYKTKLVMKHAEAGTINEFDSALMMAVMDHITVFEDGRLKIRFYDGTEFEVATE